MKLLFYHDPVTEMRRPFFWKYFVRWTTKMRAELHDWDCRFVGSEALATLGMPSSETTVLRSNLLREAVGQCTGSWNAFWHEERFCGEQCAKVGSLIAGSLNGFEPDIIVTHSPAPFLRSVFPHALLLHFEAGLMKFAPFPMSFYFDPRGYFGHSFLAHEAPRFWRKELTLEQSQRLQSLRQVFLDELIGQSPFRGKLEDFHRRYRRKILLPLQFNDYYGFDSHVPFESQFEYLQWVLDRTPADVGVLLTQHVFFARLEPEAIDFLSGKYPNLYHLPESDNYHSASQHLLDEVDAVVTVSSSIGLQSLWWRKPLIAVGDTHLVSFADDRDPSAIHAVLDRPWPSWKDTALHWLLTRYSPLASYVFDGKWLSTWFSLLLKNRGEMPKIDEEPRLFERIAAEAVRSPVLAVAGEEALRRIADERLAHIERLSAELEDCKRQYGGSKLK